MISLALKYITASQSARRCSRPVMSWSLSFAGALSACGGAQSPAPDVSVQLTEAPLPLAVTPVSEPTSCDLSEEQKGLVYRYLADQLGGALRPREHCLSDEQLEARRSAVPREGGCQAPARCGHAALHPELPIALGAHLALIDLATQGLPLQVRSMKTGYQDQSALGAGSQSFDNPNQDVSHEQQSQTQVGRQASLFRVGSDVRCLYQLKTFRAVDRDELVYQGLKELTTRLDSPGITATRYLFERRLRGAHLEELLLVDSAAEEGDEGVLLQHQLLCKLPREMRSLLELNGVTLWAQSARGVTRFGLSAPLVALPPHERARHHQELDRVLKSELFKDQAHSGSELLEAQGEEARLR